MLFELEEELLALEWKVGKKWEKDGMKEEAVSSWHNGAIELLSSAAVSTINCQAEDRTKNIGKRMTDYTFGFGGRRGGAHISQVDFSLFNVVAGRFYTPSTSESSDVGVKRISELLLQRPFRFVTVTKGCGCALGPLGNRFRADVANVFLWHTLNPEPREMQDIRCLYRTDFWLSDVELDGKNITLEGTLGLDPVCLSSLQGCSWMARIFL